MAKSLSDYHWIKLHIPKFMSEIFGKTPEEVGTHMLNVIQYWINNDYDSLPLWAKSAADESFKRSKIYSDNRNKPQDIVENSDYSHTIVNNSSTIVEQLPISYHISSLNSLNTACAKKEEDPAFSEFWKLYPKKESKGAARRAWNKIKAPCETLEKIKMALVWQKKTRQWQDDHGQYIPQPATYLNGCKWDDEPVITAKNPNEWKPQ